MNAAIDEMNKIEPCRAQSSREELLVSTRAPQAHACLAHLEILLALCLAKIPIGCRIKYIDWVFLQPLHL